MRTRAKELGAGRPAFHVKRRRAYARARGRGLALQAPRHKRSELVIHSGHRHKQPELGPHRRQAARSCPACETVSAIWLLIDSFSSHRAGLPRPTGFEFHTSAWVPGPPVAKPVWGPAPTRPLACRPR